MAGKNLSPRQKMIGMMYLVLTALLALNISKDILDAFVIINDGLEQTVENFTEKNNWLYQDFDKAKLFDPKKATEPWNKSQTVKGMSAGLIGFIDSVKTILISESEGIDLQVADTIGLDLLEQKDNYNEPTRILIGNSEDGRAGLAGIIRDKINAYEAGLVSLVSEEDRSHLKLDLSTPDEVVNGVKHTWEMSHFYHTPLAATLTMLSKIQNDVRNAEFDVVESLLKSVHREDFYFDTIAARVLAPSDYILLGDDYQADLMVAAFSSTRNPEILLGQLDDNGKLTQVYDTVPVANGLGNYVARTNKEGLQNYEGVVRLTTPSNKVKNFPFKAEYMVARPSLVVSPSLMNLMYVGIKNPLDVSVPGVPSEDISISMPGGHSVIKVGKGKYEIDLKKNARKEVTVHVSAKLNGEMRNMGSMKFRVKRLPKAEAIIGEWTGEARAKANTVRVRRQMKAGPGINCPIDAKYKVLSFRLTRKRGNSPLVIKNQKGGKFTGDVLKLMQTAKRGDVLYFEQIKARGGDGITQSLSPMNITVL